PATPRTAPAISDAPTSRPASAGLGTGRRSSLAAMAVRPSRPAVASPSRAALDALDRALVDRAEDEPAGLAKHLLVAEVRARATGQATLEPAGLPAGPDEMAWWTAGEIQALQIPVRHPEMHGEMLGAPLVDGELMETGGLAAGLIVAGCSLAVLRVEGR